MSYTTNYSQGPINGSIKTYEGLYDSTSISDRTFHSNMETFLDTPQLAFQGITFSSNYGSHGYMNFSRTLRIRESEVSNRLFEVFIYSYMKCLHNGLYFHRISDSVDMGLSLRGHASLFELIVSNSQSGRKNETLLSYNLDLGSDSRKRAFLLKLLTDFPFLKEYQNFGLDSLGTTSFFIQKYETTLNLLSEDYYSRDHIQQGDQDKINLKNNTGRSKGLNYPNGKLHITRLDQKQSSSILSFSNNPIMNGAVSADGKSYRFIPVNEGKTIVNNPSFILSKSLFIKFSNDQIHQTKLDRIYREVEISKDTEHLVCYEVFAITGIMCRFVPTKNTRNYSGIDTTVSKLENYLSSLSSKLSEDFFQEVLNSVDIEDFDDVLDEILERVKSDSQ